MAVRHTSPSDKLKLSAIERNVTRPSGAYGEPPPVENRPMTGVVPSTNTSDLESSPPAPLASKSGMQPVMALECVNDLCWAQPLRIEPPAGKSEAHGRRGHDRADCGQPR